ncbi:MAG: alginate lyase family protein [Candidatus Hydrogenedentota bacterium]
MWNGVRLLRMSAACLAAFVCIAAAGGAPRVFLHDAEALETLREEIQEGETEFDAALEEVRDDAEEALERGPWSVTDKEETPPSGEKRDYMSQGPYWWPNPDTEDGLPYVRRDGERNPETDALDRRPMGRMINAVETLGWAYYFTGEERFAGRAARLLRTWFLDEDTGMNPHLEYGQRIPGRVEGRGIGIIDTRGLVNVVEAVGLLAESDAWTDDDQDGLEQWFEQYLEWLIESDHGQDERRHPNNHGTWYDVQVASFALFTGQDDVAREVLEESRERRIQEQSEPDGRQPRELDRTLPWSYSVMNLRGYMALAHLGERAGVDIWGWESEEGHGLRQALEYLLPYATGEAEWTYEGIRDPDFSRLAPLLWKAGLEYGSAEYKKIARELLDEEDWETARFRLHYPE